MPVSASGPDSRRLRSPFLSRSGFNLPGLAGKTSSGQGRRNLQAIPSRFRHSWQAVIACLIDRAVRYHRANPVVTKLAIGGDTPPNIKLLDRHADRARADLSMRLLDQLFVVPAFADKERAAFLATEIVDTALTLSMIETGRLTASYVRLAKAAAIGFLMMQFGPELPVKHQVAGGLTA